MVRSATHYWLIGTLISVVTFNIDAMTTNNFFDPLPLYTTEDPHEFLSTTQRDELRGFIPDIKNEKGGFSITPFWQRAISAKNLKKDKVPLGDIFGTWNMLALTYSPCIIGDPLPDALQTAANTPFACTEGAPVLFGDPDALTFTIVSRNTSDSFGHLSVATQMQKVGVRIETELLVLEDFGFRVQAGVADVQQTCSLLRDLSPVNAPNDNTFPDACGADPCCVLENLQLAQQVLTGTQAIKNIAADIGLDISNFHKTSIEDLRGTIFWRHLFPVNYDREGWPRFLFIPYAQLIGTLAIGAKRNNSQQFSIALGNNGHDSIGFNIGGTLDFDETLEIGMEAGGTFFSSESLHGFRVPSHSKQQGIFPCAIDVCVKPGNNWHFIATLHARRFIDRLSAHVQFVVVNHQEDKITPTDKVFEGNVELIEPLTPWDMRMFHLALNYEISPNIALGVLWQKPISTRNAPRFNTILASLWANF